MNFRNLHSAYTNAKPFPHIVIDHFMDPLDALFCKHEMEKYTQWGYDNTEYSKEAQKNKFFTPWREENLKDIEKDMPLTWKYLKYYNSRAFIKQLEDLTGIKNLIPDNSFAGGGVHRIDSGGKLSVHTDYAKHPNEESLYRRINLLIYLNEDWNEEWGGSLQLWKNDMSECVQEIQPTMNRAVIFNTTSKSLHGHPHPLNTPENISRYSIALYYFTKEKFEEFDSTTAIWYEI
jgi:Rps23 Pro-64 3,4-dihydroxylase Tpa1-like proline 4-hydroxylase